MFHWSEVCQNAFEKCKALLVNAPILTAPNFEKSFSLIAPIIVYTDHNPLFFLNWMRNRNQRLMRWSLILQPFHLEIKQWWSVTKYNYFVTVLKYIFQVSVLYWSSFILSNFYFYFTTFQSIRSYFLLHYIS